MAFFILQKNDIEISKMFLYNGCMKKCLNCGNYVPNRNKYCSIICQKEYEYKKYIVKWKKGETNGLRGNYQLSQHIRRYMLEKNNNSCSKCGWNEINPYTKIFL